MLQSQTHWAGGFEQQRSRPPPAAETGRRGWGSAPLFQSPAKGLQKKRQAQLVRPAEWSGGQKSPYGAFLDARLAISTRAHQEIQYPNRVLDFLFCRHFFRTGRDDRCQWQKQGGSVGAAASRMRVPPKARRSRWDPRPGFLFILRGSRRPPCQTLFHHLLLKNAQTKTTVRVDGGSVIEKKQASP